MAPLGPSPNWLITYSEGKRDLLVLYSVTNIYVSTKWHIENGRI